MSANIVPAVTTPLGFPTNARCRDPHTNSRRSVRTVRRLGIATVHLNIETRSIPNHPDESPDRSHFVAVVLDLLACETLRAAS